MITVNLSDIQTKDIVSIKDGTNLGRIIDAKIDDKGMIVEFIAEERNFLKKFSQSSEIRFNFSSIKKIGSDVILIDV